ncbi:MAG: hypothetical protein M1823_000044 [Watsoniomyces obsoletus]|nr:MAG: hypothetical protein M1823_000044 [Watsoniomyces obsoletus]
MRSGRGAGSGSRARVSVAAAAAATDSEQHPVGNHDADAVLAGFVAMPVESDCVASSEQDYIDALRTYTQHAVPSVLRRPLAGRHHLPPTYAGAGSSSSATAASASASASTSTPLPVISASPFSLDQWPRSDDHFLGLALDSSDARASGRHAGTKINGSGHTGHAAHALSYMNGLTATQDAT